MLRPRHVGCPCSRSATLTTELTELYRGRKHAVLAEFYLCACGAEFTTTGTDEATMDQLRQAHDALEAAAAENLHIDNQ